jgi:hypothetical protein
LPKLLLVLVKTKITRLDIIGTVVIIAGVVGVIVSGNHRSVESDDVEARLDLHVLQELWAKPAWIGYFVFLECLTILVFWVSHVVQSVWNDREATEEDGADLSPEERYGRRSQRNEKPHGFWARTWAQQNVARDFVKSRVASWADRKPDLTIRRLLGFLWACEAGILAGQTLIFGKSLCGHHHLPEIADISL